MAIFAPGIVAFEVTHSQIMHVDVFARLNGLSCEANNLPITSDRIANSQCMQGDFMPCGNITEYRNVLFFKPGACGDSLPCDNHIIFGIQF